MNHDDELYTRLLVLTREMYFVISKGEISQLNQILEERETIVYKIAGLKNKRTEHQKRLICDIIKIDKEANSLIQELDSQYKSMLKETSLKSKGLFGYSSANFNLSAGRLIDKRR